MYLPGLVLQGLDSTGEVSFGRGSTVPLLIAMKLTVELSHTGTQWHSHHMESSHEREDTASPAWYHIAWMAVGKPVVEMGTQFSCLAVES